MTMCYSRPRNATMRAALVASLALTMAGVGGCGLLDVADPTKVEQDDINNATSADLMRRRAIYSLELAAPGASWYTGLLSDEYQLTPEDPTNNLVYLDVRYPDPAYASLQSSDFREIYLYQQRSRFEATLAIQQLRAYAPESRRNAYVGQMLALRGFSALSLGEVWCSGFPLHELKGFTPVYGPPLTTTQVFERALADLDSAVALAVDSARILSFAKVARGRVLLDLGRFAEAGAAVTGVPNDFVLAAAAGGYNMMAWGGSNSVGQSVGDHDGGNGLDFVSADDPRLPTTQWQTTYDGLGGLYVADKYVNGDEPITLASGIEARLIEAEAALATGGPWLDILNALRVDAIEPDMTALTDPGSPEARVDLLYRERAFWLFGTTHRLGDLRRLIDRYGRSASAVFPSGVNYGVTVSLPFPDPESQEGFSPGVTGCTAP